VASIRVEAADGVAVVTLDEPDRRNALHLTMVDEIVAAFDGLEADESIGAVVVTGAPPAFCAGADLGNLGSSASSGDSSGTGMRAIYEGFLRVARSSLPTIAAVNGAAVGAGMNLALCCDVRLAGRRARFDTRFLQLGLHPGGGHTWMLRRAVGPQAAAAMVLFGAVVDGAEAERIGLAWRCVDDGELLETALGLAAAAADVPRPLSVRAKQTLAAMAAVASHDEAVDRELEVQTWSAQQPFFAERLAAMRDRISKR